MLSTPTDLLLDTSPAWSIFDVASPARGIAGIGSDADWQQSIRLHYSADGASRMEMPSFFDGSDPDITTIADPSVWAAPITTTPNVHASTQGLKATKADALTTVFRPFFVHTSQVVYEGYQQLMSAGDDAETLLQAHVAGQVSRELADSLFTKNPGLYRTAVDQSGASAVDPLVGWAVLYEAFDLDAGNAGDAVVHVPYHAVPFLMQRSIIEWRSGALVDCYGNAVHVVPGGLNGPLTDADDLETSTAPAAGEGWFYITPSIYASVGTPRRVEGDDNDQRGLYAKTNEEIGFAEAPALVAFRPVRTHAVNVVLNAPV